MVNYSIMTYSSIFSNRLKRCMRKNKIPRKMILCHGRKSSKKYVKHYNKTIFVDFRKNIAPDLCVDVNDKRIKTLTKLKSKFKCISSIYAPITIFFNTRANYIQFHDIYSSLHKRKANIFRNREKKLDPEKITKSNLRFRTNFLQTILHFLTIGGYMEFTDDFIFVNEKRGCKKKIMSESNAIKVIKHLLGEYDKFFEIQISRRSQCIKKEKFKRFGNIQKFIRIKKIREPCKRFIDNKSSEELFIY
jgi:hypothetical protein